MSQHIPVKVAVLDDYQGVARTMADWSALDGRAEITVLRDHLDDPAAVVDRLRPFDVLCVMRERTPLPRAVLERLERLRLIVSTGARNASIDAAAAEARGIVVRNTGSAGAGAMELTWALILAAIRHIPAEVAAMRSGGWQHTIGGDLKGRRLGIVGLGKIGAAMARVAAAFEMEVLAWSPNLTREHAEAAGAHYAAKDALLANSDIVTLHLVLSDRSRGIIGAGDLGRMRPDAWIVNTSRGPLIDEAALIDALRNRHIAGAALDVYDVEPLSRDNPLRTLDNVVLTPHIGFVTENAYRVFYRDTVRAIVEWLDRPPG